MGLVGVAGLDSETIWFLVKIGVIILLMFYQVFAFVMVKQVNLMANTLGIGFEKEIRATAKIHLIVSIAVLLLSIVIL
jgi:hypothetical protein